MIGGRSVHDEPQHFARKRRLVSRRSVFIVGADTLSFGSPIHAYYGGDESARDADRAIDGVVSANAAASWPLVEPSDGKFQNGCRALQLPDSARRHSAWTVPEAEFRVDISSTDSCGAPTRRISRDNHRQRHLLFCTSVSNQLGHSSAGNVTVRAPPIAGPARTGRILTRFQGDSNDRPDFEHFPPLKDPHGRIQTGNNVASEDTVAPLFVGVDVGGTNIKIGDCGRPRQSASPRSSIPTEQERGPARRRKAHGLPMRFPKNSSRRHKVRPRR